MKKIISILLVLSVLVGSAVAKPKAKKITVAIPNDPTNEARALLLLQDLGYITLKGGKGLQATPIDIKDNPYNIKFVEAEAAQLPNVRRDVDYALINSNYALGANLNPSRDALAVEGSSSAYVNILSVKQGRENEPVVQALVAALKSSKVKEFITNKYDGAVISVVNDTTDGYDEYIDYDSLKGKTISVAATPTPHAEILEIAKDILKEKEINLKIVEFTDYIQPNNVVESGEIDANYFQHVPYLNDFNAKNGTHIVSVLGVHVEPFGIYGGKQKDLSVFTK
ncbi:MAG: hypothetical protein IIT58_09030 [Treponema sp.]|nr:hypothetical protein [Treponema sp.]